MKFTQIGWVTLGILGVGVVLMKWLSAGNQALTDPLEWFIPSIMAGLALMFGWLTVQVKADAVRVSFGVGLIRRSWPLTTIAAVRPVRNELWTGWGIRLGPGYTLYNVSGREAVELKFKDGSWSVRIGTNQPDFVT